jgi:hypothetical protein
MKDADLDRLLHSAAGAKKEEAPIEAPFGFDTRVVALWRANGNGTARGLRRLVRQVALIAAAVIVIATAGTYHEIKQSRDINGPFANEFAIADSAIQDEVGQ